MSDLDDLLTQAREADPGVRITLRDPIAAQGDLAIEAMTDWLGDPRLAAFAVRVLERIGREHAHRLAVVEALSAVDRAELPQHLISDLDGALAALGSARQPSGRRVARPPGLPGLSGRGYWVMRTSPWDRPYIWAEARAGRLRQGWGVEDEQNLEVIAATLKRGGSLSGLQLENPGGHCGCSQVWTTECGSGDVVVAPNLPELGRLSVFRVSGSYAWVPVAPRRFRLTLWARIPSRAAVGRRGPTWGRRI